MYCINVRIETNPITPTIRPPITISPIPSCSIISTSVMPISFNLSLIILEQAAGSSDKTSKSGI